MSDENAKDQQLDIDVIPKLPTSLVPGDITGLSQEAEESLCQLGVQRVGDNTLKNILKLGNFYQSSGIVKLSNGYALVTQGFMANTIRVMLESLEGVDDELKPRYAQAIGYLGRAMSEMQSSLAKLNCVGGDFGPEQKQNRPKSFTPGQDVQPSGTYIKTDTVIINEQNTDGKHTDSAS